MKHDWARLPDMADLLGMDPDAYASTGLHPPKCNVHQCRNCGAITLSDPGGPPDESLLMAVNPRAEPCDVGTARRVLES